MSYGSSDVFSSALFPLGARPFGRDPAPGLKMAVIDWPVRWMMALLPLVLFGFYGRFMTRIGVQRFHASDLELHIGGPFILDGSNGRSYCRERVFTIGESSWVLVSL